MFIKHLDDQFRREMEQFGSSSGSLLTRKGEGRWFKSSPRNKCLSLA